MTGRELLKEGRRREAEAQFLRDIDEAPVLERPRVAQAAALIAYKAGEAALAVRLFRRAEELSPRDPELPHSRGLAHLELGEVGLAQQAQAAALALDPDHVGARAQRAGALEALGDDAGAAHELTELLKRLGPQPALSARLIGLQESARHAASRRLLGRPLSAVAASPLVGTAFARTLHDANLYRAPFGELRVREGKVELMFESLDSSMGRSDLSYGGSTEEEDGRRVPLDEFSAAAIVFLSEALGIGSVRARRMLAFLLTPECGMTAQRFAGARVGWTVEGEDGTRRYGLYAELP
jgi:tetratricopeptide (TPR) repeat protein